MLKFLNALAALAGRWARSSSRFLTRMKFGLRSVGARAVRTVEGICVESANKNARGSDPGHLTKAEN